MSLFREFLSTELKSDTRPRWTAPGQLVQFRKLFGVPWSLMAKGCGLLSKEAFWGRFIWQLPQTPSTDAQQQLDNLFGKLAARWKEETSVYSATWQIKAHRAYQEIVRLGEDAITLLLGKLAQPGVQCMMALSAITGEDPSPVEHAGNIVCMAEDWLAWGKHRGCLHGDGA